MCVIGRSSNMQKNAAVLTAVCFVLCLSFNYTFPLHRDLKAWPSAGIAADNHTTVCPSSDHRVNMVERTKKMASNLEFALRKLKNSTQDMGRNLYGYLGPKTTANVSLSEEDLRNYEQLVIMKKNPYLDLKELELKYSPSSLKNARQSVYSNSGPMFRNDPSIVEPTDDVPSVEIINRGLSGFAIPPIRKHYGLVDLKGIEKTDRHEVPSKSAELDILGSLRDEVMQYKHQLDNK